MCDAGGVLKRNRSVIIIVLFVLSSLGLWIVQTKESEQFIIVRLLYLQTAYRTQPLFSTHLLDIMKLNPAQL